MQAPFGDSDRAAGSSLRHFISRNLTVLAFLSLALAGMMGIYVYFSPVSGVAEVVAAGDPASALAAPFVKRVPARPVLQRLAQSPGPIRIALIAGHRGFDSGAECEDGLTEVEVTEAWANQVAQNLRANGITVEVLDEFDPRLDGLVATALISIHADSCQFVNELATGFKIAGSSFTDSSALSICVEGAYRQATQLNYHANTITPHMTDYHAFRKITTGVPALIIEIGFLNLDRDFLTNQADVGATAIAIGVMCYIDQVRGTVSAAVPVETVLPEGEGG